MKSTCTVVGLSLAASLLPAMAWAEPPPAGIRQAVPTGPLWNDSEARSVCHSVCRDVGVWTGGWWMSVPYRASVCECFAATAPPLPPQPQPPPPRPMQTGKHPVEAGPIWSNEDANQKCPRVCQPPEAWNGQWWTTVQGQMSVCECAPAAFQPAPPPQAPAPPRPQEMPEALFGRFMQHLNDVSFTNAQLSAIDDEVRAGSRWNTRQLIAVMKLLNFGDAQVKGATKMWPSIVDPQNLPDVLASLTFESDRQKLRKSLHR
jgi:hypothetical protein